MLFSISGVATLTVSQCAERVPLVIVSAHLIQENTDVCRPVRLRCRRLSIVEPEPFRMLATWYPLYSDIVAFIATFWRPVTRHKLRH